MSYLILCAGDRSMHKVALSILNYFFQEHKLNQEKFFVCVSDGDKDICNFLKKKKLIFFVKILKTS